MTRARLHWVDYGLSSSAGVPGYLFTLYRPRLDSPYRLTVFDKDGAGAAVAAEGRARAAPGSQAAQKKVGRRPRIAARPSVCVVRG